MTKKITKTAAAAKSSKAPTDKPPHGARRQKVLDALAKARSMELFAISQYMLQHYILDDMDYGKLAAKMRKIAIDEMRHAEELAERIKDLDGTVTADRDKGTPLMKEQGVEEIYPFDYEVENDTITVYNDLILICRQNGDMISAQLLEDIIKEEQEHLNYFEDTDDHIKNLGNSYLARQAEGNAD